MTVQEGETIGYYNGTRGETIGYYDGTKGRNNRVL